MSIVACPGVIVLLIMILGIFRAEVVLKHYRGYEFAPGERVTKYVERVIQHPAFKATCSDTQLYYDSYER